MIKGISIKNVATKCSLTRRFATVKLPSAEKQKGRPDRAALDPVPRVGDVAHLAIRR